jgi:hypothetical protein
LLSSEDSDEQVKCGYFTGIYKKGKTNLPNVTYKYIYRTHIGVVKWEGKFKLTWNKRNAWH